MARKDKLFKTVNLDYDSWRKTMKESWIVVVFLLLTSLIAFGQRSETVLIEKKNLQLENLRTGNSIYIGYSRKTPISPAEKLTLVQIGVEPTLENGRKVFAVTQ